MPVPYVPGPAWLGYFQVLPFQCRIKVLPVLVLPTAQASFAETAVTPDKPPLGLDCSFHEVPSQCWMNAAPELA